MKNEQITRRPQDGAYYRMREAQERGAAAAAGSERVRDVHEDLARRYGELARRFDASPHQAVAVGSSAS